MLVFAVGEGVEVVVVAAFAQDAFLGLVHTDFVVFHFLGRGGVAALLALNVFVCGYDYFCHIGCMLCLISLRRARVCCAQR